MRVPAKYCYYIPVGEVQDDKSIMKNNPLISILLPVYNTSAYLHQCLDSVLAQTYTNLQVVLVDDGSKDNSLEICQQYAAKDSRIEVYHQENQGVATARNVLLSKIKGDYFLFVDSDDWIEPIMVEYLLSRAIVYKAEMVTCGMVKNDDEPSTVAHEKSCCQDDVIKEFLRHVSFNGSLCNKLSSVQLLKKDPRFNSKISYGEDALFCWELLKEAKTIVVSDRQLYHYRMNAASLSHLNWTPEKKGSGHLVWKSITEDVANNYPQYLDIAKARYAIEDMWGLYFASLSGYPHDEHIRERQLNIRRNLKLICSSGLVSKNKVITACALAFCYPLGKLLKYIAK